MNTNFKDTRYGLSIDVDVVFFSYRNYRIGIQ